MSKFDRLLSSVRKFLKDTSVEVVREKEPKPEPEKLIMHSTPTRMRPMYGHKILKLWEWGEVDSHTLQSTLRRHPIHPLPHGAPSIGAFDAVTQKHVLKAKMGDVQRVFGTFLKEMIHNYGPTILENSGELKVLLGRTLNHLEAPEEVAEQFEFRSITPMALEPVYEVRLVLCPKVSPRDPLMASIRLDVAFLRASASPTYAPPKFGSAKGVTTVPPTTIVHPPADLPEGSEDDFASEFQSWAKGDD